MKRSNFITTATFLLTCATSPAQMVCPSGSAFEQLDINNVRANYYNNGVEWNNNPEGLSGYEIPKDSQTHSIFNGRMWIAGLRDNDSLYLNVGTYTLFNWYNPLIAGPMNNIGPGQWVTSDCIQYDHIYKLNRSDVVLHRLYFEMLEENGGLPPQDMPFENGYTIPENILNWPAHAEVLPGQPQELAPFFDSNCCGGTPGIYEPELGDYPAFRFPDNEDEFDCEKHLLGDQVLWWVVSDNYEDIQTGPHTFSSMGMEIQNMVYAYITDNDINNTTFMRRTIINRSGFNYSNMYFGQFVDVDLGNSEDDYFGNHINRGMTYIFNGPIFDANNQGTSGYGQNPPAIGFDWVGGPLAESNDGIDNDFDGLVDEPNERLRLYHGIFHNRSTGPLATRDPQYPSDFYNYMCGKWRDNTPLTHGGMGYNPNESEAIPCLSNYPGDSDPLLINTHGIEVEPWSEITDGNPFGDRRHIMSSGPFNMSPDESKVFTMAIVWARDENCTSVPCSVDALYEANDLAQETHDNCYELPCNVPSAEFSVEIENGHAFLSSPLSNGETYNWSFGNGETLTTEFPFASFQYSNTGEYAICLEIDFGCGLSSVCDTIEVVISSVHDLTKYPQIELYPNPAKNQLHIQLSGIDQQPTDMQIFSLSGQLVKRESILSNEQHTADISALPNGVYILKLASIDGKNALHSRFVVVR